MKTLFKIFVLAALSGCGGVDGFLRTDTASIVLGAEDTSSHRVTVACSSSWMVDATSPSDWLTADYSSSEPDVLFVSASVNESLEGREGSVRLVSGDGMTLTIPVTQGAMDVRFVASPVSIPIFGARETATHTISVDTGLAWTAALRHASEWIVLAGVTGSNSLTVGVRPTRSLDERRDTLVLYPIAEAFHSLADSVAVVQRGLDLLAVSPAMDDNFTTVFPADGGSVTMSVYSRAGWTLTTAADAERVRVSHTDGGADIENGTTIEITATENGSTSPYIFTLTFSSGGEIYDYICRQQAMVTR